MKEHLSALVLVLSLVVAGCDSGGPDDPPPPIPELQDGIQPLQVGASWTYAADWGQTIVLRGERKIKATIDGQPIEGWVLETYSDGVPSVEPWDLVVRNSENGLETLAVVTEAESLAVSILEYPYPAEVGDVGWQVYFKPPPPLAIRDTLRREVVSLDESFSTPSGFYRCIVYRTFLPPPPGISKGKYQYDYFVPSIGLVGREWRSELSGDLIYSYALVEYELLH